MGKLFNCNLNWNKDKEFSGLNSTSSGSVKIGKAEEGNEFTSPKQLFLQSLAGCSGMIVLDLIKKMRAGELKSFNIDIQGECTEENPSYFKEIILTYIIEGEINEKKLIKSIKMSETNYCGLVYTASQLAKINTILILNGEKQIIETH